MSFIIRPTLFYGEVVEREVSLHKALGSVPITGWGNGSNICWYIVTTWYTITSSPSILWPRRDGGRGDLKLEINLSDRDSKTMTMKRKELWITQGSYQRPREMAQLEKWLSPHKHEAQADSKSPPKKKHGSTCDSNTEEYKDTKTLEFAGQLVLPNWWILS